jgi:hypothetical protein
MMRKQLITLVTVAALTGMAWSARAALFTASYGSSANFTLSGSTLTVTLTSGRNATSFGSVLTAVFFNANATATPVSATTAGTLVGTGALLNPFTGNVGGEWEYLGGGGALAFGASQGISSTGLGIFGNPNFNGPNLSGPVAVGGGQFGLVASENGANLGLSQSTVVRDSATFTLTAGAGFDLASIGDVTLFYGTSLEETSVADGGTTLAMLGFALVGVSVLRRKLIKA